MSKTKFVLSSKNIPARLPIFQTLVTALALDHWNAPGWAMCATAIVLFLYWGVCAGKMIGATEINIFEDEKESAPKKSSWQEKLDKMQKVHAEKESVIKDHIK